MPNLCSVIVSMVCIYQLTGYLLFKNKHHQLPLKSPVKTSGKGWLVHTAALNQSQMSPQKLFLSFPHCTPLSNRSFPFSSPHVPFPVWDCVDGWSSAVVIWHSCWLSVCLFLPVSSVPCLSLFLSLESASCQTGMDLRWPSTAFTIIQGEKYPTWQMLPKKCILQNNFQLKLFFNLQLICLPI